jgi:hypothetical protein
MRPVYDVGSVILLCSITALYSTGHWIGASILLFIDIAHRGKR